jgi:hypothetical protein
MMTRRHFVALADALRLASPVCSPDIPEEVQAALERQQLRCIKAIADACAASNGRFDRGRFYRAAGAPQLPSN